MVLITTPFVKGQKTANVVMESVWQNARIIDPLLRMILNRAPSRAGHPSLTREGFLCKGILAWEDELPNEYSAVNAVFALLFGLRAQLCNECSFLFLNHNHS